MYQSWYDFIQKYLCIGKCTVYNFGYEKTCIDSIETNLFMFCIFV